MQVRRAILWVNLETNNPINFEKFGHMTSLRLWEIGRVSESNLAPLLNTLKKHSLGNVQHTIGCTLV